MTDAIILHHYDGSPFAHKARLMMGFKGLDWQSVIIPMIMPKPDLMPLTGGYRKTPVMQIGADIYCDTQLIAAELERRHPVPSFFPEGGRGLAEALSTWADQNVFGPAVNFVMANIADKLPPEFFADRAAMRGAPPPDTEKMKAAAPRLKAQLDLQLQVIDGMLEDGRPFLLGEVPGLADVGVYQAVWMLGSSGRRAAAALEGHTLLQNWMQRVEAIGTGRRTDIDAKDALKIAQAATPAPGVNECQGEENAPQIGARVSVQSDDRVPEPVTGEIVLLRQNQIGIRREAPEVGAVTVHFPRRGYIVRPA